MAILGFQLVTTLVGACILSKIITYYSCTRFLFDGLLRFLAPSNQSLLDASGSVKAKSKARKRRSDTSSGSCANPNTHEVFYFPRALSLQLQSSSLSHLDVAALPLYTGLQWLVDFTVCAFGIYLVTELSNISLLSWFTPKSNRSSTEAFTSLSSPSAPTTLSFNTRLNLSLVWLVLSAWFTLRSLISMTAIYFRSFTSEASHPESQPSSNSTASPPGSGEWFLIIATGFCFLILAGFFMALDDRYFGFDLQTAYTNLTLNATVSPGPPVISWGAFNAILAFTCAFIGALFVYPGMKFGKIYLDAVSKHPTAICQRFFFHLTFIMPLFSLLLWVKPITDQVLRSLVTLSFNPVVMQQPTLLAVVTVFVELFGAQLATLRLVSCLLVVFLRIMLTRRNLQTYLNSAQDKLDRFTREPGQTSNKEVQRLVASIFYCINLVALQWIAPTILLLCIACLYKNTGGLSWLPFSPTSADSISASLHAQKFSDLLEHSEYSWKLTISETRAALTQFTEHLVTRGMVVCRGVFGFLVWWCLFALQAVSFLGLAYHRFTLDY